MMDENPIPPPPILDGSIQSIKFSIATPKEIKTTSINDCSITHASQLMNPFLGLPLESGKCEACGTVEQGQCEGHFGFIELPVPVFHPCHVSHLRNILSLVCLKCLRMKKGKVRLDLIAERTKDASCPYCRGLPPISVKEVKTSDGATSLELKVSSKTRLNEGFWNFLHKYGFKYGDTFCRPLLPTEVLEILKRFPEDTKRRLAGKGHCPQYGYILQSIPVPPNCLYVPDISDGKSSMSNDISIPMLRKILNKIDLIKRSRSGPPNFESLEIEANELQAAIAQYMHLRGTKKAPIDNTKKMQPAIEAGNLSAKQWLEKMRSLFISKGSGYSSRSVITGDAYKGTNEIGIPSEIAKKITFEERVTSWNLKRLQDLVDNRQCLRYGDGSSTYSTEEGSKGHTYLRIGQVVNRRIMDGDIVFVNRPPTTHKHALQAFSVYVHDDHTVKINPLICAPFGADFDGDCVHIFYPQSLTAKAEVMELFSVEQQLCSSHSGNLNLQLVNDSLLALKVMHKVSFLTKQTAQQLGMFISPKLPPPALFRAHGSGPLWTVLQILMNCLPAALNCSGDRHLIRNSEILKADLSRDSLQMMFTDIATSILVSKGPKDALKFVNVLQPLLMEILFLEGFSISIRDFYISEVVLDDLRSSVQEISSVLHQLRLSYNELIYLQVESYLKSIRSPIVDVILSYSSLGDLAELKSESAIVKVVQQLGFVGSQLFLRGKLYSRSLVDDMFSHYVEKYSMDGNDHPSEAYGLIKNSFFHGLNPFEELVHSISSREVIVRSTRGLAEPGTLFKNLMAILRDVAICYDGTVRNVCSNSIIQFEYEADGPKTFSLSPPGEPVGVLAATAISNPAYKAVLDSSQSTNSSWELMKEVLLSKVSFSNDAKSRRVILYLEDCLTGKRFYKEKAACIVQSCLRKVTLKECAVDFSIIYQSQISTQDDPEAGSGLVGHIHLDKARLSGLNRSALIILQKCQDAISHHRKKGQLSQIFKRVDMSASECCSCTQPYDAGMSQFPCLQFSYHVDSSNDDFDFMEKIIHVMANIICPILLDTIIKGDPRIHSANITWIDPESAPWVKNSCQRTKGEVAVEVVIAKDVAKRNGDAWRIAVDACIPVMHLIDTRRSIPYGIQQIQDLLGISCTFDQTVQRLSTAIRTVARGVLKEHLMLVAHSMTCSGNIIGFNTTGYKALFRSLNIQVPFTEATLVTPMKCFERAAERCHMDSLSSIVASSLWGKNVAIGTGTRFQIVWNQPQVQVEKHIGNGVYDFLHMVRSTTGETVSSTCLGVDVDELIDEHENLSPERDLGFGKPTFDENDEIHGYHDVNSFLENMTCKSSGWENVKASGLNSDGWLKFSASTTKSDGWEKFSSSEPKSNGWKKSSAAAPESDGWQKSSLAALESNGWGKSSSAAPGSDGWEKYSSAASEPDDWEKLSPSVLKPNGQERISASVSKPNNWDNNVPSTTKSNDWEKFRASVPNLHEWEKNAASAAKSDMWGKAPANSDGWQKSAASKMNTDGWQGWGEKGKGSSNLDDVPISRPGTWSNNTVDNLQNHNQRIQSSNTRSNWEGSALSVPNGDCQQGWGEEKQADPNNTCKWSGKKSQEQHVHSIKSSELDKFNSWSKISVQEKCAPDQCGSLGNWNNDSESCLVKDVNSELGRSPNWNSKSNLQPVHNSQSWDIQSGWSSKDDKNESWNRSETQTDWDTSASWSKKNLNSNSNLKSDAWANKSSDEGCVGASHGFDKWNDNRGQRQSSQPPRSQGWGSITERRNPKMHSEHQKNWNAVGIMTATGRRLDSFTSEEGKILVDIEPIMQSIRKILHQSSYNDGDRLSEEDQSYILEKIFKNHPDGKSKVSGEIDYIMVDKHKDFSGTRCFFVVSTDGSSADFSYIKCVKNFVLENYENAEIFCKKYFRQQRPESQQNENSRRRSESLQDENLSQQQL